MTLYIYKITLPYWIFSAICVFVENSTFFVQEHEVEVLIRSTLIAQQEDIEKIRENVHKAVEFLIENEFIMIQRYRDYQKMRKLNYFLFPYIITHLMAY